MQNQSSVTENAVFIVQTEVSEINKQIQNMTKINAASNCGQINCGSLLLLFLAVRIYTLVHLLC